MFLIRNILSSDLIIHHCGTPGRHVVFQVVASAVLYPRPSPSYCMCNALARARSRSHDHDLSSEYAMATV